MRSLAAKAEIAELGLPYPALLLTLTVICQAICGLTVLLGFWTRLGALVLLGFTVVATLLAHVSHVVTDEKKGQQLTTIFEHLAIVGGLMFLIIYGAGNLSIDSWLRSCGINRSTVHGEASERPWWCTIPKRLHTDARGKST